MSTVTKDDWSFAQRLGWPKHEAHANIDVEACPHCGYEHEYNEDFRPRNAVADKAAVCPECGSPYLTGLSLSLDLTEEFEEFRRQYGHMRARDICDRLATRWGKKIGALEEYKPAAQCDTVSHDDDVVVQCVRIYKNGDNVVEIDRGKGHSIHHIGRYEGVSDERVKTLQRVLEHRRGGHYRLSRSMITWRKY